MPVPRLPPKAPLRGPRRAAMAVCLVATVSLAGCASLAGPGAGHQHSSHHAHCKERMAAQHGQPTGAAGPEQRCGDHAQATAAPAAPPTKDEHKH